MRYEPPSESWEAMMARLNNAVFCEFKEEQPSRRDLLTLQIVGLPRSGTTVLYQLLARSGALGYPSNIMALFWKAPHIGAAIQKKLATSAELVSLESYAGRTSGPMGPHEFGYFWRNALGHSANSMDVDGQQVEGEYLQNVLDLVNSAFDRPTVYKNFLVPAHYDLFFQEMERQRFLYVRRDPVEVVSSLLKVRREISVSTEENFGTVPAGFTPHPHDCLQTVIDQVIGLLSAYSSHSFESHVDVLALNYTEICNDPRGTIETVCEFAEVKDLKLVKDQIPARLENRSSLDYLDSTEISRIEKAL